MKKYVWIVFLLSISIASKAQKIEKVKIEDVVHLMDTSSVPLIVNFWATWCKPCVHELVYFEAAAQTHKDKMKLVLVSLDFETDFPKGIADFAKKNNIKSKIVWLDETDAEIFCPKIDARWEGAIPATLMINKKKGVRDFYGQQLTEPQFYEALKKILE